MTGTCAGICTGMRKGMWGGTRTPNPPHRGHHGSGQMPGPAFAMGRPKRGAAPCEPQIGYTLLPSCFPESGTSCYMLGMQKSSLVHPSRNSLYSRLYRFRCTRCCSRVPTTSSGTFPGGSWSGSAMTRSSRQRVSRGLVQRGVYKGCASVHMHRAVVFGATSEARCRYISLILNNNE
eukprot:scaffold71998_cov16-Tisochrysis_lutea.AAC.2